MSQTKGDRTKEKIINRAILLFSKHGYEGTSMQQIAEELRLSKTAAVYHFGSKFGLFSSIVRYIFERRTANISSQLDVRDNGIERLHRFLLLYLGWVILTKSEAEVFLLLHYFASNNREFNELYEEITHQEKQQLMDYLLMAEREGQIKLEGAVEDYVDAIYAYMNGKHVSILTKRKGMPDMRSLETQTRRVVNQLIGFKEIS